MITKNCIICNKLIFKKRIGRIKWEKKKFCSPGCHYKFMRDNPFKNKGQWKKGEHPSLRTEFKSGEISYEKHPGWKGESVGKKALHHWIINQLGRPSTCEHCGKTNLFGHKIHWANKEHIYKRNLTDWLRLCVSCHQKYDNQNRILSEEHGLL